MEDTELMNITAEEYVKFLHISISYIENKREREEMINHLYQVKEQLHHLETCYQLEATYEPKGSV